MHSNHISQVLFSLVLLATASVPCHAAESATELYTGVTLLDPATQTKRRGAYILVENGRIAAIGIGMPDRPLEGVRLHDLTGLYALPGFIDAHAHITAGPQKVIMQPEGPLITNEGNDAITAHSARVALAFGVTTVRNPGGDPEANARYDRSIASGALIGPEALHAGAVIQPPPMGGVSFAYPKHDEEWRERAAKEAALGMRYFKLYVGLSEAELAKGIEAAHRHGLKAIAHLNAISWTKAAELGIDGLEHALPTSPDLLEPAQRAVYVAELGPSAKFMYRWFELVDYDGPLMRQMFDVLRAKQVVVNLTLVVNKLIYHADDLDGAFANSEWSSADIETITHPEMLGNAELLKKSLADWTAEDYRRARAVMPRVLEFARRLHRAGVPMYLGTDGLGGGPAFAHELALHVEAGIPVWEVLRMATSGAADLMGIGARTGRLAPGYEADIVFLSADPFANIMNAEKVDSVLNNGKFYSVEELLKSIR